MLQQMRMLREAQSDAARLAIADQARAKGDNEAACRIYLRLAGSRTASQSTAEAQNRLGELEQEAQQKLADLRQQLATWDNVSPSEEVDAESSTQLAACIAKFDELADQYGRVPQVGREIKTTLARHKSRPQVRAALSEPDARRLWDDGQALEEKGQICCAFLLYEAAVRKLPAPSAQAAERRLTQLRADPQQVAAAEACRSLQWCHQQYRTAERVARVSPRRAQELFEQIVQRAPADSPVYAAAPPKSNAWPTKLPPEAADVARNSIRARTIVQIRLTLPDQNSRDGSWNRRRNGANSVPRCSCSCALDR